MALKVAYGDFAEISSFFLKSDFHQIFILFLVLYKMNH